MRTLNDLEQMINGSVLFSIDRATDGERFAAEERIFLNNLVKCVSMTFKKDFAKFGLEIFTMAKYCVKAYNAEKGPFMNYFNFSLKKSLETAKRDEDTNKRRGGMSSISEKTEQFIRNIKEYMYNSGKDPHKISDETIQKIANNQGVSFEVVYEALKIDYNATVKSGDSGNTDDGEYKNSLFDTMLPATGSDNESAGERAEKIEAIRKIVVSIDSAFREQQERTKPLLAKLLTAIVIKELEDVDFPDMERVVFGCDFFDNEMYADYKANPQKIPTAHDIAEAYNVHEASASRTLHRFLKKIRQKC